MVVKMSSSSWGNKQSMLLKQVEIPKKESLHAPTPFYSKTFEFIKYTNDQRCLVIFLNYEFLVDSRAWV